MILGIQNFWNLLPLILLPSFRISVLSIQNKTHLESLSYAIDNGVNLLDTASNYQLGDSERLIGEVLSTRNREGKFIISKAGYIQGNDTNKFLNFLNPQKAGVRQISVFQEIVILL